MSNLPIGIYFASNGTEIVFVSLTDQKGCVRIQIQQHLLPGSTDFNENGIVSIAPFSPTQLMLTLTSGDVVEFTFDQIEAPMVPMEGDIDEHVVDTFLQQLTTAKVLL